MRPRVARDGQAEQGGDRGLPANAEADRGRLLPEVAIVFWVQARGGVAGRGAFEKRAERNPAPLVVVADQARAAAQTTIDFIKEKLPESMRGYVDMALNSGMIDDVANQAGNMLGGLFGGTKG